MPLLASEIKIQFYVRFDPRMLILKMGMSGWGGFDIIPLILALSHKWIKCDGVIGGDVNSRTVY